MNAAVRSVQLQRGGTLLHKIFPVTVTTEKVDRTSPGKWTGRFIVPEGQLGSIKRIDLI